MSEGYTPTTRTIWDKRMEAEVEFHVRTARPPLKEMRDSLGRMRIQLGSAEAAAEYYRQVKKLPLDWPLIVEERRGRMVTQAVPTGGFRQEKVWEKVGSQILPEPQPEDE